MENKRLIVADIVEDLVFLCCQIKMGKDFIFTLCYNLHGNVKNYITEESVHQVLCGCKHFFTGITGG